MRINTPPLYQDFPEAFPQNPILSSRGKYFFPLFDGISAPVSDSTDGDSETEQVSAYGLYTVAFGVSPDKVFGSMNEHPFVAGGFV